MVKKLVGDDPNANRKFWFTVAAAIGQPGNAFANMATGFKQATLNADADRKQKNKMLMELSKDEMDFMKDVDSLGFKSELKLLGLTKAQQIEVANMDSNIRKRFLEEYKIRGDYLKAMAAADKAKADLKKGKGDKSFRGMLQQGEAQIGKQYAFVMDELGNFAAGRGSPTLDSPLYQDMLKRLEQFRKFYTDKLNELGSTSNIAQLEAYTYATANTPPKIDIANVAPVGTFRSRDRATIAINRDKSKYINKIIQIGGKKYKVVANEDGDIGIVQQ